MGIIPVLIVALCVCPAQTDTAIASDGPGSSARDDGKYLLPHRFEGKFSRQFSDLAEVRLPFADAEYEFTHVEFLTRFDDDGNARQRVWVSGQRMGAGITPQSSSASLGCFRQSIPEFEELKSLKSIQDFELKLGQLGDAIGAWGSDHVLHSSKHWRGYMVDDDGNLRGVQVFLHTVNYGKGWEIEHRHVHEGIFRPETKSKNGG